MLNIQKKLFFSLDMFFKKYFIKISKNIVYGFYIFTGYICIINLKHIISYNTYSNRLNNINNFSVQQKKYITKYIKNLFNLDFIDKIKTKKCIKFEYILNNIENKLNTIEEKINVILNDKQNHKILKNKIDKCTSIEDFYNYEIKNENKNSITIRNENYNVKQKDTDYEYLDECYDWIPCNNFKKQTVYDLIVKSVVN